MWPHGSHYRGHQFFTPSFHLSPSNRLAFHSRLCPLNHLFLALRTLSVFYFSPSAVVPGKRYPPGRLHSHLFVCPPPVLPQSCSRDSGYRQSQLPCQFVTLILRLFWRLMSLRRKASSFCASVSSLPNLSPSLPSRNIPRSP